MTGRPPARSSPTPLLRSVAAAVRPVAWLYALSLVLLLVVGAMTALKAWVVQPVVDAFLGGAMNERTLLGLALAVAAIFSLQAVVDWFHLLVSRAAGGRLVRSLRERLFDRLLQQSLGYFDRRPTSELASRVVHDVGVFEDSAINTAQMLFRDVATLGFLILVLMSKDWRLAVACLGVLALVGWALRRTQRKIQGLGGEVQSAVAQLQRGLTEMVSGFELVVGFGRQKAWSERFRATGDRHHEARMRAARARGVAHMKAALLAGLGISAILFITGRALLDGAITAGDFGSFLAAIYLMQTPALSLGQHATGLFQGLGAARSAFAFLDELPPPPKPVAAPWTRSATPRLVVEDLTFAYREGEPALNGVGFSVEFGETVALVGDSGSGKSTLAKLLMAFYEPRAGRISFGGAPLDAWPRDDLYRELVYVPQETFQFDESIEFNLRVGDPDATPEELEDALRVACLDGVVAALPAGLETPVGERGRLLSGGQRQRLAIARASLRASRFLLLDEATSGLGLDMERRVLENLARGPVRRSLFVISHRPSVAQLADRILVLARGRLVESGTYAELMESGSEFKRLQVEEERGGRPPSRERAP